MKPPVKADAPAKPSSMRWLGWLYRRVRAALTLLGLFVLIYAVCFDLSRVYSPSMSPTLQGTPEAGDWVLSENVSYWFRKPHRWEIVRFTSTEGMRVMKRVVGLPGERISLAEGRPVLNGQRQDVPPSLRFLYYYAYGPKLRNGAGADCGDGYFVFGDDSKDSWDSRYEGPLAPNRVQGRPWLRVWPMNRIGFVNP